MGRSASLMRAISFSLTRRWAISCSIEMISSWCRSASSSSSLAAGPVPVLGQDLAEHAGRRQSGHAGQIDGGFGVAGPPQHATLLGQQQVDVSGTDEIVGL